MAKKKELQKIYKFHVCNNNVVNYIQFKEDEDEK